MPCSEQASEGFDKTTQLYETKAIIADKLYFTYFRKGGQAQAYELCIYLM